jgi:hypothetical protein
MRARAGESGVAHTVIFGETKRAIAASVVLSATLLSHRPHGIHNSQCLLQFLPSLPSTPYPIRIHSMTHRFLSLPQYLYRTQKREDTRWHTCVVVICLALSCSFSVGVFTSQARKDLEGGRVGNGKRRDETDYGKVAVGASI